MVLSIFFSYAHRDRILRDRLEDHLSNLKYRGLITTWHAGEISAGEETTQQIHVHLRNAHIILLLISADFLASEYCYSQQMMQAVQRHERGEADVILVLLRPVVFTDTPFAGLKSLPTNKKPVVNWRNRDSAFVDIALGIEYIVQSRLERPSTGEDDGPLPTRGFSTQEREEREEALRRPLERMYYTKALAAYEQALSQNNLDAAAYRGKGNALAGLERYGEALNAFEQSVALISSPPVYARMGDVFRILGRYDEAVSAYKQALALDASYVSAYAGMSKAFLQLGSLQEAEQVHEQAKQLEGNYYDDSDNL